MAFDQEQVVLSRASYDKLSEAMRTVNDIKAENEESYEKGYNKGRDEMYLELSYALKFIKFLLNDVELEQIVQKYVENPTKGKDGDLTRTGNPKSLDVVKLSLDFPMIRELFEHTNPDLALDIEGDFKIIKRNG